MPIDNERKKGGKPLNTEFSKRLRPSGIANNVPYSETMVQEAILSVMQKASKALELEMESRPIETLQEAVTLLASGLQDKSDLNANPRVVVAKFTTEMASMQGLVTFDSNEQKEAFTAGLLRDIHLGFSGKN